MYAILEKDTGGLELCHIQANRSIQLISQNIGTAASVIICTSLDAVSFLKENLGAPTCPINPCFPD